MDGFTDVLLPTDRWAWSDLTGVTAQPLHSFLLPSNSWEWEGDWYVDQVCAGGDPIETGVRDWKLECQQLHNKSGVADFEVLNKAMVCISNGTLFPSALLLTRAL